MTRRDFLRWSAGTVALSAGGSSLLAACKAPDDPTPSVDPNAPQALRIPRKISGGSLSASYGAGQVFPGASSHVISINGELPSPSVEISKGDLFSAMFANALGEPSIIHWHGLNVPPEMDGHPKYSVQSGASYNYQFPLSQRAATYWYHAHPDKLTAKQAYLGLAGAFIVHDAEERAFDLPSGNYDIPLLLQDKRVGLNNAMDYTPTHEDVITGWLGNTVLVNGTPNAYLNVEQTLYRFRLINASNARVYKIAFSDNRKFHLIGTDGGLIEKPEELQFFNLSPGERAEILVDFASDSLGGKVQLRSLAYDFTSEHRGDTYPQGMELTVLDCRITAKASQTFQVPSSLTTIEKLNAAQATKTQSFDLTMDHSKMSGIHMINNLVFAMDRIDVTIPKDSVELWEFNNTGDGFHSMHVHGAQFQVSERLYAGQITPIDYGWKDTVLLYPNESVRILVRFQDHKGLYLLHCHTLEHEDDGMMLNIMVS